MTPRAVACRDAGAEGWIHGRRWDVAWLIGSSAIVPAVLLLVWGGASSLFIMLAVTAVVGGPHLFSTYVATFLDPRFRRAHALPLLLISLGIPAIVVYGVLTNFQVLLSVFIFLASLHVLQQNAYLTDIYRRRAGHDEPAWSRLVDYGLLMLSIYPIASYKLVHSSFYLGKIEILIPEQLRTATTYWTVWLFFAFFLAAWLLKTAAEARQGTLNVPKTLLIGVTTLIAFLVPMAATGERLELAFQSVNAWHSVQYLGIVWLILRLRSDRGLIESRLVRRIAAPGRRGAVVFYGFCLGLTLLLFAAMLGLYAVNPFGLGYEHYYYMTVLSFLLVHYAIDGYMFTVGNRKGVRLEDVPFATPAAA